MKRTVIFLAAVMAAVMLLCACSSGGSSSESNSAKESSSSQANGGNSLSDVWSAIKNEVSFSDFNEFTEVKKLQRDYGITEDMVDGYAGGINGSGVNQEEVVLVKAKDDSSASKIKEQLDARFQSKLNQNENYNPEQAKMIEGCQVEQHGLYVTMIVSDNAEKITKIFKEQAGI